MSSKPRQRFISTSWTSGTERIGSIAGKRKSKLHLLANANQLPSCLMTAVAACELAPFWWLSRHLMLTLAHNLPSTAFVQLRESFNGANSPATRRHRVQYVGRRVVQGLSCSQRTLIAIILVYCG